MWRSRESNIRWRLLDDSVSLQIGANRNAQLLSYYFASVAILSDRTCLLASCMMFSAVVGTGVRAS